MAAATLEAHHEAIRARRSEDHTDGETKVWYTTSLIKLSLALEQAKDPPLRKSIALAALGYANSLNKYEASVSLLEELLRHDREALPAARRYAELGGVYERLAELTGEPLMNLEKASEAYANAIKQIESSPRLSPQAYRRLIPTYAGRGRVAERLHELSEEGSYKEEAASSYRAGKKLVAELKALSASGKRWESDPSTGGHGDSATTYTSALENLLFLRYDERRFAEREKALSDAP